jgi:hypothetical protein
VRKTVSIDEWGGDGFIIALGSDYLAETGQDLVIENSELFTNSMLRQNAKDFIVIMFPYKDNTIVFDEYGRKPRYIQNKGDGAGGRPNSIWDIMPIPLRLIFLNCCFLAFCVMFFYKQRVGETISPEGFSGRNPLEGVSAMANAMLKARVFRDCVEFYYKFHIGKNNEWDKEGRLGDSVNSVKTEREAVSLISEIDRKRILYKRY